MSEVDARAIIDRVTYRIWREWAAALERRAETGFVGRAWLLMTLCKHQHTVRRQNGNDVKGRTGSAKVET